MQIKGLWKCIDGAIIDIFKSICEPLKLTVESFQASLWQVWISEMQIRTWNYIFWSHILHTGSRLWWKKFPNFGRILMCWHSVHTRPIRTVSANFQETWCLRTTNQQTKKDTYTSETKGENTHGTEMGEHLDNAGHKRSLQKSHYLTRKTMEENQGGHQNTPSEAWNEQGHQPGKKTAVILQLVSHDPEGSCDTNGH